MELIPWTCRVCKRAARIPQNPGVIHCACGFTQYRNPPGIGDRIAALLARLGITERRYRAVKATLGMRPICRCKERQQRLNGD